MTAPRRDRTGFTLLEAILAVALIALVLTVLHTSLWVSVRSYRAARGRAAWQTTAATAGRLLADDAGRVVLQVRDGPASLWSAPEVGSAPGEGMLRMRLSGRLAGERGPALVDYFYVAGADGDGALLRRVQPLRLAGADDRTGDEVEAEGRYEIVAGPLDGAGFRFWDGQGWSDRWDAAARGGLPRLIELTLDVATPGGTRTVRRVVSVPVEAPLLDAEVAP